MCLKVYVFLLIGVISVTTQAIENNGTTLQLDSVNDSNRSEATEQQKQTNTTVTEFFGYNTENNTKDNEKMLTKKPDISSKVDYTKSAENKRYRIKDYNRDPLEGNEQSQNPFVSGVSGARNSRRPGSQANQGFDPQVLQLLQNNPRLRLLAEQNPEIAQQILRNPRLLRDPRIASLIRSQLGEGGGGGLLSLLPGLGAALNPLGIGLGGGQRGSGLGGGLGGQNDQGGLFGAPRGVNNRANHRNRANEENIGGGYYGNNQNYGNNNNKNNNQNTNTDDSTQTDDQNDGTNADTEDGQDYDNAGQDGEGTDDSQQGAEDGTEEGQEAQDPNQDPSNDPDIQQLQNLGGGAGDNFPEGLFPPGLLSKEDLDEIRKEQEKQAKEQAQKERQQQGGQTDQANNEGQDYDYGNNEDANGGEGEQTDTGEAVEDNADDGQAVDENTTPQEEQVETTPAPTTPVYQQNLNQNRNKKFKPEFGGHRQSSANNPGVEYDEILDVNTPVVRNPSVLRSKGRARASGIQSAIPVPGVTYNGQQPTHLINQQPVSGIYQQPYGQQPPYQQPIQYYPQYPQQQQYIPQQQYVNQQYPQQFVPQQQYMGQQTGQYLPQQPLPYQPIPVQNQGYLPQQQQQPIYNQYAPNPNVRVKQLPYSRNQRTNRVQNIDPNIANHRLNTIPHDDSEDTEINDQQSSSRNLGVSRHNGRSFQQQPRILSSSAAQNTESSVAFNSTEPTVLNKYNQDLSKDNQKTVL